jgi:hypothetical protein
MLIELFFGVQLFGLTMEYFAEGELRNEAVAAWFSVLPTILGTTSNNLGYQTTREILG